MPSAHPPTWAGAAAASLLAAAVATAASRPAAASHPTGAARAAGDGARAVAILERRCFECHGPETPLPQGGLLLGDREAALRGGDSGPALVPGEPEASLLVHAVRRLDPDLAMPPEESLPPTEVEELARWVAAGAPWPAADGAPAGEAGGLARFETEVRPLLEGRCFPCHGPAVAHPKSGFRMDGRAGFLKGGERGPALVPGDPAASRLLAAVRYTERDLRMPPDGRLADEEIAALERWIAAGAPVPDDFGGGSAAGAAGDDAHELDLAAARGRWAYAPVVRPPVPEVRNAAWVRNPVDAFVLARLEAAGLEPSPPATPRELVRRAYFVVLGLPPTLEEIRRFEEDERPDAWERLVDELLARPEYGERWARHWLDVVRFAQTNGYERDAEKPYAWRYRDWVVRAFDEDLPYDRFVLEQLAGDELADTDADALVATGFWRIGAWDDEPDDELQAQYDGLDDSLRTASEAFLGTTIGCARCHDHRFDPFSQEDYYGLLAFVRGVAPYEKPRYALDSSTLAPLDRTEAAIEAWKRGREERVLEVELEVRSMLQEGRRRLLEERIASLPPEAAAAYAKPEEERTPEEKALLERPELWVGSSDATLALDAAERARLRKLVERQQPVAESYAGDLEWALVVREVGPEPVPTRLLARGLPSAPGPVVPPRFPRVLCPSDTEAVPPAPEPTETSSGLRLRLAQWIASPENPLTARVEANRVWHHAFGRGIVPTPNDFGAAGLPPTHPELLDWLASELVARGWSRKELLRLVLGSATWRQSSRARSEALAVDPANDLLWRQRRRRLEAEAIRDALYFVSGELRDERGGRGFFPALSKEALAGMSRPGAGWEPSSVEERARRSVYAFVKRGMLPPFFTVYDAPDCSLPIGARPTTTTATQALTLLNGPLVDERAAALARRVAREAGPDPEARVERAVELVLARAPTPEERRLLGDHLRALAADLAQRPPPVVIEPRVPERVAIEFLESATGADVLLVPEEGWTALRGAWGDGYNGTVAMDAARGPAALWDGARVADGRVEARLAFARGCTLASLFVRAEGEVAGEGAPAEVVRGIEVALLPRDGTAELRLHGAPGEAPAVLGRAEGLALAAEAEHELWIELAGERVAANLDGAPLLEATSAALPRAGRIGAAARGGALRLHALSADAGDGVVSAAPRPAAPDDLDALGALCLVLLDSNELVYVD